MSPCYSAQQRGQSHLRVKKKGPACPRGAGRERGDASFADGLSNLATGSAKPVQSIRPIFAKKSGFFSPIQITKLSFYTHAGARSSTQGLHLPTDAPKHSQPQTFFFRAKLA